jgi:Ca2+/Na+ antiporter
MELHAPIWILMLLVYPWVLAVVIGIAVWVKWKQFQYEHAISRSLLFGMYVALTFLPDIPIETARFYTRWFILVIFIVEIFSFYLRMKGKKHV